MKSTPGIDRPRPKKLFCINILFNEFTACRVTIGEEQLKGLEIDAPTPRPDPKPVPPYTGMLYPYTGMFYPYTGMLNPYTGMVYPYTGML